MDSMRVPAASFQPACCRCPGSTEIQSYNRPAIPEWLQARFATMPPAHDDAPAARWSALSYRKRMGSDCSFVLEKLASYLACSHVCATTSGLNSRSRPLIWSITASGCVDLMLNFSTPPGENCAPRDCATNRASRSGSIDACSVNLIVTESRLRSTACTSGRSTSSPGTSGSRR